MFKICSVRHLYRYKHSDQNPYTGVDLIKIDYVSDMCKGEIQNSSLDKHQNKYAPFTYSLTELS